MTTTEQDYVLGTDDVELQRLGLQHRVWRPTVLECWQRAGITEGCRVIDVGSGPGFATLDLAQIVGPTGSVVAIERSARFIEAAESLCRQNGVTNVEFRQSDVMQTPLPAGDFDVAWMRWLACFVDSPTCLVDRLAAAVRHGGMAVIHEYADYAAWRLAPPCEPVEEFTREVMQSWRDDGGEPDIALHLPDFLERSGFRVISTRPHVFCIRPTDYMWRWPAAFLNVNLDRLVQLGRVTSNWAEAVRQAFNRAEKLPTTRMITPIVLEIIARRT